MTLAELQATPQFAALQPQQQRYVTAFCSNGGNALAAAKAAYPNTAEKNLRVVANRNQNHKGIRRLTDTFMGISPALDKPTKDELLVRMGRKIMDSGTDDKILLGLLQLYGKWEGYETEKAPAPDAPKAGLPEPDEAAAADILNELNEV
jgi:hypothetical protein